MKNRYTLITAALLCLCSCSLKEQPQGYVTRENFYRTESQCNSALRGCYTPIHYIYNHQFMMAVEGCTDLWFCNTSDVNATLAVTPASCGVATNVWNYGYKGVARANECVECIAASPLDEAVKLPLVAEARAMRALYYYILTSFFGGVPFYTESVSDIAAMEHVRTLPRTLAPEIRAALYNDLKDNAIPYFTEANGLKCRANQVASQHAGYALSLMLMAKFAVWDKKWDDALYALDLLEETYGEFSEAAFPLEKVQWRHKNTDEGIFEIQHEWSVNGVKFYGNVSGLMSPRCTGKGVYDGVYMPELSANGSNSTPLKVTKHFALFRSANGSKTENAANRNGIFRAVPMKFTNDTYLFDKKKGIYRYCTIIDADALSSGVTANGSALDRRIAYTIGMGRIETAETFATVRNGGFFFGGPKFWCLGMTATYDSNNYRIFRYADAVLLKAESLLGKGSPEEAVKYLNLVRRRAGIPDFSYTDDAALLAEIQNERARELGGEFQRKFDLVRWGIWFDVTKKWNEEARLKSNIRRCHEYYPIPDTECGLSGGVLTNDAYVDEPVENE